MLFLRILERIIFIPQTYIHRIICIFALSCMDDVILASSTVDCGFEPWSDKTKDYQIGICCLSANHT
jgi:hypothetical protein